ncbi:arginase family protein [Candidatus Woesearchaeota archaeon]|nr:arginase family protein [Candidatus Woesearchaeota archaeon]
MRLFAIDSGGIIKQLKGFPLTEAGILPVFDVKELKDKNDAEKELADYKHYCCLLSEDSEVTYHAFKAFAKNNPGSGIIVFSSQPEAWLKRLVEEHILDKNNMVLVGTRSFNKESRKFMLENSIKNFSMREISFERHWEIADSIMSVARQWGKIYICINLDCLDPSFVPAATSQHPGGLTTRELLYFIYRLKMLRNIGMAQVTGFSQEKDDKELTSKVAAKLVVELS